MADSRFDKLTKSVIESDHPIFSKVRKELPRLGTRSRGRENLRKQASWFLQRFHVLPKFIALALAFFLSFFLYGDLNDPYLDYTLGEVAPRPLLAPRDMQLVDEEAIQKIQSQILASEPRVYRYFRDGAAANNVERVFAHLREVYIPKANSFFLNGSVDRGSSEQYKMFLTAKGIFNEGLGLEYNDSEFAALLPGRFRQKFYSEILNILSQGKNTLLVAERESFLVEAGGAIEVLDDGFTKGSEGIASESKAKLQSSDLVLGLREFEKKLRSGGHSDGITAPYRDLGIRLVKPNLFLATDVMSQRYASKLKNFKPITTSFKKGEVLIGYGEVVTSSHVSQLRQMSKALQAQNTWIQILSATIFLFVMIYTFYSFIKDGFRLYRFSAKDTVVCLLLLMVSILALKSTQFIVVTALAEKFPHLPFDFYMHLLPVTVGAVLIRMIMAKEPALVFSLVWGVIAGIVLDRNLFFSCYVIASSMTAVTLTSRIKTRGVIYRAGLLTGLVNVMLVFAIVALSRHGAEWTSLKGDISWIFWSGMISGILLSMLAVSVLPIIELVFGYSSDLRLLELANMNHPLLRDLMIKAPGTYHHSIVIGSLVEAAAEAIGANPLLARVMAHYHDVGKMERPLYFIENQAGGYNRHDALQPHMSAMIIREHVKRGQELGRKHKLPQPVIDAMSEHHGSSTIWYFYNKAKSQASDPVAILESDYQYDGAKPQSKETALVMLGDVVEASTRSIVDPSPLRLSGVVKNILNKYFAEGQLSECELTLKDLDLIAKSFLDVLVGIYHARIEYGVPMSKEGAKKNHASSDKKGSLASSQGGAATEGSSVTPISKAHKVQSPGSSRAKKG